MVGSSICFDDLNRNSCVRLFVAREVITINPNQPKAKAVAVYNDKIIGVGQEDELLFALKARGIKVTLDKQFKDYVIYPGFIEAHMHPQIMGLFINLPYVGYFDRTSPDGGVLRGLKSFDDIIDELKRQIKIQQAKLKKGNWLNCWSFDPMMHDNKFLTRDVLDMVSKEYPICVSHQSGHLINLNTKALKIAGYFNLPEDILKSAHLFKDSKGNIDGTVAEPDIMSYAFKAGAMRVDTTLDGLCRATKLATEISRLNGCTTIVDKGTSFPLLPGSVSLDAWQTVHAKGELATRVQMEPWFDSLEHFGGWSGLHKLRENQDDKLTVGNCKLLIDGSIQGFTAYLLEGTTYKNKKPNGQLLLSEEDLRKNIERAEENGFSCSIHTNGNGATEVAISVIEQIRAKRPNSIFRHSLEHNQLASENQFFRMNKAGIVCNLFINHIYYWGDVHSKYTVGEYGVRRMNACRSAQKHRIIYGIHSDDLVTEVNPLFSAWCAVNRKSGISGKVYGQDQCLNVDEALRTITYNHAYLLNQEHLKGSIEIGKYADFTVLLDEVTQKNSQTFKDIPIVGTVLGGRAHIN